MVDELDCGKTAECIRSGVVSIRNLCFTETLLARQRGRHGPVEKVVWLRQCLCRIAEHLERATSLCRHCYIVMHVTSELQQAIERENIYRAEASQAFLLVCCRL